MDQSDIVLSNNSEQSSLDIRIDKKASKKHTKKDAKKAKKQLQRTEKWREERRGNWTGSQLKTLMTAQAGKGRLKWSHIDRLFSFGLSAIKYIYENAKERQTGRYIDEGEGTYEMRYGTKVEPLIFRLTKEKLSEMKIKGKLKKVGYIPFPSMPNAGVSSDAKLVNKKGKTIASVEMKACTTWKTHYERTFEATDDGSKDFWQLMGQLIAHDVNTCYYVVAEPPQDIKKYLFYDGNIQDLYEDFKKECPIKIEIINPFELQCEALKKRIRIAEDALNDWLSTGGDLKETLDKTIAFYENAPEKLELDYVAPIEFQKNKLGASFFSKKKVKKKLRQ